VALLQDVHGIIRALAVGVACLSLAPLGAAEQQAVHASPEGELRVELIAAATPEYIREWVNTPHEHDVHVKRLRVVSSEQTFYVAVVATGYELDEQGMTDLICGWRLIGPSSTPLADERQFVSHKKRMTHRTGFVMLDPAIDLTLEVADERGLYTIEATVEDRVSGKTASNSYQIRLTDHGLENE
jgi:hypothetical protein